MLSVTRRLSLHHTLLALVVLSAIVVAMVLFAGPSKAAPEPTLAPSAEIAPIPTTPPAAAQAFKTLRAASSQTMPAAVRDQIGNPGTFGRNASLARRIQTTTGTGWVIPAQDGVCIAMPDPVDGFAMSCQSTKWIRANGLYVGLQNGTTLNTSVTLLVQDDVTDVHGTTPQKKTIDLPIDAQGVATGVVPAGTVVTVNGGGEATRFEVGATRTAAPAPLR